MRHIKWGLAALLISTGYAQAAEENKPREAVECMPAKPIVKFLSKFSHIKPEQRDNVDAFIYAHFDVQDGGNVPGRMFYRFDGKETALPIEPDGTVPTFPSLADKDKKGELCVEDKARAGLNRDEDGIAFKMDMDIRFKNQSGTHNLPELKDGAKDGKTFYKIIVPGPVSLMVPKMTHVTAALDRSALAPDIQDAADAPLTLTAMKGAAPLEGLVVERFGKTYVISLEQLETLGADSLKISGAPYILEPSPSIEKMKKLGFSEEESGEAEE